jgi:hypothetical protein
MRMQESFVYVPGRRVDKGYSRRSKLNRKKLKAFTKGMAAKEKLYVSDTFQHVV